MARDRVNALSATEPREIDSWGSRLTDKVVLITGGSGGLGRALARAFVTAQTRVVIAARSQDRLSNSVQAIGAPKNRLIAHACDVTDKAQVESLDRRIREEFGPVEILINNAGIARAVSFLDMTDVQWEEIL